MQQERDSMADPDSDFVIKELTGWSLVQLDFGVSAVPSVEARLRQACGLSIPVCAGRSTRQGELHLFRITDQRLWLIADSTNAFDPAWLACNGDVTTTELGHGQRRYRMQGARLFEMLVKGVAVDLQDLAREHGRFVQTQLHHVPVTFHCVGERVFNLHVPRSFSRSIETWMADAVRPFGNRNVREAVG
jgi:heterotetrameric sarcosine oxidase gamma subunit